MGADKRCAASGRALQVESAASEIHGMKTHLRRTLPSQSKCMHENRFAATSLPHNFGWSIEKTFGSIYCCWADSTL